MVQSLEIVRYDEGTFTRQTDSVVEERLAQIFVNGRLHLSVMASPGLLDCLAVGYLCTEGLNFSDIENVKVQDLRVEVTTRIDFPPPARARTSGFGLGSVAVENLDGWAITPPLEPPPPLAAQEIIDLMACFNHQSRLFQETGAVHSAWLVTGQDRFFADDVGRHNAIDKVIGQYFMAGLGGRSGLILTTGRVSTEILLKAAKTGLGAVISRGAPTDRAVELARRLNIILIGFARRDRFNIYHGQDLVIGSEETSS